MSLSVNLNQNTLETGSMNRLYLVNLTVRKSY